MVFNNLNEALETYRSHWSQIPRQNYDYKTLFAVMHGIIERTKLSQWNDNIADYFFNSLESLRRLNGKISNPCTLIELIRPALNLGLPVQTPRDLDSVGGIEGTFGLVDVRDDGEYDISMYNPKSKTDPKIAQWSSLLGELRRIGVELDDIRKWDKFRELPQPYQEPDVWVCWVAYIFKNKRGAVGNFEPACKPNQH